MITKVFNELIVKKGVSNRQLAKECGVSGQTVANWRSGSKIPADILPTLSRIFKICLNDFFPQGDYIIYGRDVGSVRCVECENLEKRLKEEERVNRELLEHYLKLQKEIDRLTMK